MCRLSVEWVGQNSYSYFFLFTSYNICLDFPTAQRRVKLLEGADMVVKAKDKFR